MKNKYKGKSKEYTIKSAYNLSIEKYNNMLKSQNYSCFICGKHQSQLKKPLHIDHNHQTGKVRKLLCNNCNCGMGLFSDNVELVKNALNYLEKYK